MTRATLTLLAQAVLLLFIDIVVIVTACSLFLAGLDELVMSTVNFLTFRAVFMRDIVWLIASSFHALLISAGASNSLKEHR